MFGLLEKKEVKPPRTCKECILLFAYEKQDWFDPDYLSRDFVHVLAKFCYDKAGRRFAPSNFWRTCRRLQNEGKLTKSPWPLDNSGKISFKIVQ